MAEVSFGEWLKRRRGAQGWTQKQLAQQINCSISSLRKMEAEERRPSVEVIERLSEIFNVPREEHKAFLRFTRGDWQAISSADQEEAPWRVAPVPVEMQIGSVTPRHNLPLQISSFIGREKAQAEVMDLVAKHRLVSLVGAGGIGKTRLSLEVARDLFPTFPDGLWFIELAPLADPTLVAQVIVSALGLIEQVNRSPQTTLINFLKAKRSLLILDNCEHLVQTCAQLAETLLQACPDLKILITSREALGVSGESLFNVATLSIPDIRQPLPAKNFTQYEAVRLFIERAQTVVPDFRLTEDNALAISRVCHDLDGIPLAIELAAARIRGLSIKQIAALIDDRFRLLTTGPRTVLPRHQTLQALIDWSHDLLSDPERILFRRLSAFAGGWTLEAAEAVCAGDGLKSNQILDLLLRLVDKSLVVADVYKNESRYHMLETVRQYAREKLLAADEGESMRQRHLAYFVDLAERAEPNLRAFDMVMWLDRLESELDNIRVALEYALGSNIAAELRLASAVMWFWWIRSYRNEGIDWLERGLSIEAIERGSKPPLPARAMLRAQACYTTACLVGWWRLSMMEKYHATSLLEESLALFRELGSVGRRGMAYAIQSLGGVASMQGDLGRARTLTEDSLKLFREMGDKFGIAECNQSLVNFDLEEGNILQASMHIEERLALSKEIGDKDGIAMSLAQLGRLAAHQGDRGRAISLTKESLVVAHELGNKNSVAYQLEHLAYLVRAQSQARGAVRLLGAAEALRESINAPIMTSENIDDITKYDHEVTELRAQMGEDAFAAAWKDSKKMTLDEAVAYALGDAEVNVG